MESGGRGQVLKRQWSEYDNDCHHQGKGKHRGFPQCFPRYKDPYIPINWSSDSRYQYDLHHELPLPKKDVPIPLYELEILLGTAPTPDGITRSNFITEDIRNTDINDPPSPNNEDESNDDEKDRQDPTGLGGNL